MVKQATKLHSLTKDASRNVLTDMKLRFISLVKKTRTKNCRLLYITVRMFETIETRYLQTKITCQDVIVMQHQAVTERLLQRVARQPIRSGLCTVWVQQGTCTVWVQQGFCTVWVQLRVTGYDECWTNRIMKVVADRACLPTA